MTDNEIVKALEEHYKQVDKGYSTHLEYGGKGDEHEEKYIYLLRDVLDLINRLQAENERLKKGWKADAIRWIIADVKAEAYKEFAERLKENFKPLNSPLIENRIDNLLKELVGEDNEQTTKL